MNETKTTPLATLTREQREAVRVLIARAWTAGHYAGAISYRTANDRAADYARLALPEPPPRTVTRPRVEVFGGEQWRIVGGAQQWRYGDEHTWQPAISGPCLKTRDDAARWLALWDNPTETVEVPANA